MNTIEIKGIELNEWDLKDKCKNCRKCIKRKDGYYCDKETYKECLVKEAGLC